MVFTVVVFTVKASGTPPLSYRWRKDNRELQDGGNVSGATTNVLTLNNVGTNDTGDYEVVIRNTAGATNARARLTVNRRSQAIDFKKLPDKRVGDPPFALGATADSRLSVVYQSSKPEVATVSSNTVTILNAGTTTITASQPGDGMYLPASSVEQKLSVLSVPTNDYPQIHALFSIPDLDFVWVNGLGSTKSGAYVAVNELSWEQYTNLANDTKSVQNGLGFSGLNLPVAVPFAEASRFLDSLNKSPVVQGRFRLPTLDEYKIMAGLSSNTSNILSEAELKRLSQAGENFGDPGGIGALKAIADGGPGINGLHQVVGNVVEWTAQGETFGISFRNSTGSSHGRTLTNRLANLPIGIRLIFEPGK